MTTLSEITTHTNDLVIMGPKKENMNLEMFRANPNLCKLAKQKTLCW